MDFRYTEAEERFRMEVRAWLVENLPQGWGPRSQEPNDDEASGRLRRDWERRLYHGGWAGINWPKEYGGRGASAVEQAIFLEESARANAPLGINVIGRNLTGPVLMKHGTERQKQRFLPPLLAGEEVWCQGFSEPNAGSDLASLRCRATVEGEHFKVNGQKIWTSSAQHADWCIALVRTDPAAPKHKGISFLLIDMKSKGILSRPLKRINGKAGFSEVFFDDVVVPAENLVGELNGGWHIAISTLTFERGAEDAMARNVRFKYLLDLMTELARDDLRRDGRPAIDDPVVRQKLAASYVEVEVMRLLCLRAFSRFLQGREPGPEAMVLKLYWSHVFQRLTETAMDLPGPAALLAEGDPWAVAEGLLFNEWVWSKAATIYSGTSEIQRNIIAERALGLPRQRA